MKQEALQLLKKKEKTDNIIKVYIEAPFASAYMLQNSIWGNILICTTNVS